MCRLQRNGFLMSGVILPAISGYIQSSIFPDSFRHERSEAGASSSLNYRYIDQNIMIIETAWNGIHEEMDAVIKAAISLDDNAVKMRVSADECLITGTIAFNSAIILSGEGAEKSKVLFDQGSQPIYAISTNASKIGFPTGHSVYNTENSYAANCRNEGIYSQKSNGGHLHIYPDAGQQL